MAFPLKEYGMGKPSTEDAPVDIYPQVAPKNLLVINEGLPADFFNRMPRNARAVFSTGFGHRVPRNLPKPASPYILRSNSDVGDEVRLALELRNRYSDYVATMQKIPATWDELWEYFDAVDAFTQGSAFLLRVITLIVKQNQSISTAIDQEVEIWVKQNYNRLATIDVNQDVMTTLFTPADSYFFQIEDLRNSEVLILCNRLNKHRASLEPELKIIRQQISLANMRKEQEDLCKAEEVRHENFKILMLAQQASHHQQPQYINPVSLQGMPYHENNKNARIEYQRHRDQLNDTNFHTPFTNTQRYPNLANKPLPLGYSQDVRNNVKVPLLGLGKRTDEFEKYAEPIYVYQPNSVNYRRQEGNESQLNRRGQHPANYPLQHNRNQISPENNIEKNTPSLSQGSTSKSSQQNQFHQSRRVDSWVPALPQQSYIGPHPQTNSQETSPSPIIYVGNLTADLITNHFVENLFSECGTLNNVHVLPSKNCALFVFQTQQSADRAVCFNNYPLRNGTFLRVDYKRPKIPERSKFSHPKFVHHPKWDSARKHRDQGSQENVPRYETSESLVRPRQCLEVLNTDAPSNTRSEQMTQSRPYLAHQNFPWGDEKQILSSKSVATSDIMPKPNQTAPNHGRGLSGESRRWDKADRMSTPLSKARGNKTQIDRTRGSGSGTIKRFKSRDQEDISDDATPTKRSFKRISPNDTAPLKIIEISSSSSSSWASSDSLDESMHETQNLEDPVAKKRSPEKLTELKMLIREVSEAGSKLASPDKTRGFERDMTFNNDALTPEIQVAKACTIKKKSTKKKRERNTEKTAGSTTPSIIVEFKFEPDNQRTPEMAAPSLNANERHYSTSKVAVPLSVPKPPLSVVPSFKDMVGLKKTIPNDKDTGVITNTHVTAPNPSQMIAETFQHEAALKECSLKSFNSKPSMVDDIFQSNTNSTNSVLIISRTHPKNKTRGFVTSNHSIEKGVNAKEKLQKTGQSPRPENRQEESRGGDDKLASQKENIPASCVPALNLADTELWPALGPSKPEPVTNLPSMVSGRSFAEIIPQPCSNLILGEPACMTSVSDKTPEVIRRLTAYANSPGCDLWPVVKRWTTVESTTY